jgi:hypothetical protein
MATMLNGAAVMDAALLLIAGNEPCPQPQTSGACGATAPSRPMSLANELAHPLATEQSTLPPWRS